MNNDLISREALKEALSKRLWFVSSPECDAQEIKEVIDNAPTVNHSFNLDNITEEDIEKFKIIWQRANSKGLLVINEERTQGEWEEPFEHNGKMYHKCNHCHASIPLMLIDNYCSYCGAEMKGGAE